MRVAEKVCSKCAEKKPLEAFPHDARLKSGRSARCSDCNKKSCNAYYWRNAEKARAAARAWYAANKGRASEKDRRWREANPDGMRHHHQLRKARRRGAVVASPVELRSHFGRIRGSHCVYCGKPGEQVDHVVPVCGGGPHAPENLVQACAECNYSKHARPLGVFLAEHPPDDLQVFVTQMAAASCVGVAT